MATRLDLDLDLFRRQLAAIEARAAECAGDRPAPRIVIVSKYLSSDDCRTLRGEGFGPLGENRAQDLEQKVDPGEDRDGWHFIGHLQRNKIGLVLPRVSCLHSLDSERLARSVDRWVDEHGSAPLRCLVQVNIAGETQKGGLAPFEAKEKLPAWIEEFGSLSIAGLMTMAPLGSAEEARPVFAALRDLRDGIRAELPDDSAEAFSELSMGMSGDYEVAAEEGATLLRIGRILYTENSGND